MGSEGPRQGRTWDVLIDVLTVLALGLASAVLGGLALALVVATVIQTFGLT